MFVEFNKSENKSINKSSLVVYVRTIILLTLNVVVKLDPVDYKKYIYLIFLPTKERRL